MIRTFAGATALMVGCVAIAQGPVIPAPTISKGANELPQPSKGNSPLDDLKKSRSELKKESETSGKTAEADESSTDVERREMRKRLDLLLKQLENRPKQTTSEIKPIPRPPATNHSPETKGGGVGGMPEASATNDALLLATNLYKSGEFVSALNAFRIIDLSQYPPDDRGFILYMTASCLRRTGKLSEAASMYRELANDKFTDSFIIECALWQVGSLRTREEMEKQLAQLRQRREAMTPK